MSAPAVTDRLAGITVAQVEPGDVVVVDAVFGMERVLAVETLNLESVGQPWPATKLQLRGRYGEPRNVLRFPQEPCVRVTTSAPLAGEEEAGA